MRDRTIGGRVLRRTLLVLVVVAVAMPVAAVLPTSRAPLGERVLEALTLLVWVGWWLFPPGALAYAALLPRVVAVARRRGASGRAAAVAASPLVAVLPLLAVGGLATFGSPTSGGGPDLGPFWLTVTLLPALAAGAVVPLPAAE